ncbi:MAG: NusG domain II-containing protein [Lachnospiraceae bacterium]|nr:NusG domain II-containing protein [Lachnospiraceae bacterium]
MKIKRNDILLIGALLVVAVFLFVGSWLLKQATQEPEAVVLINGKEYARYPLDEDRVVELPGKLGSNLLTIEGGEAYMSAAVCPDKICMGFGKIRNNTEQIVCIPGGIVVIIENGEASATDVLGR